jgi:hypothetical protein
MVISARSLAWTGRAWGTRHRSLASGSRISDPAKSRMMTVTRWWISGAAVVAARKNPNS